MAADVPARAALGRHAHRFVIEELLGAGGFGRVFRAFDRRAGIDVALKMPHRFDPGGLLALKREFRALSGLSHPNLAQFHELFATEAAWFFTMDLVDGRDVLSFLDGRRLGRAPDREAVASLVLGLEALHGAGVLHRDLKPSNAWIDARGNGVLLDFGLAQPVRAGASNTLAGTPAYLAPELLEGQAPTAATDAYALGVLLFEAATGKRAFEGDLHAVLGAKLAFPAPRVLDAAADVPDELARTIDALLSRVPEQRPALVEVRRALGSTRVTEVRSAEMAPGAEIALGRAALLDALERALDAHRTAVPTLVRVRGAPGIGKSTVLAALAARLRARRDAPLVLSGRASEHETVPYALVDGVVDALAQRLLELPDVVRAPDVALALGIAATAFPVLASHAPPASGAVAVDPHEARRRIAAAIAVLLARAGGEAGCVVLVDDAQWADRDGLALLAELARTREGGLSIVLAHRDETELESALSALAGDAITVPPLTEIDAERIAAALVGASDARRIARAAGGSPFLVDVLARAGASALADLESGLDVGCLAERAIAARVDGLPASARALVDLCMIAGHPIRLDVAAQMADGAPVDQGTLRRITDARLVHARAPLRGVVELAPYHDRIREIVSAHVPPPRRAAMHRSLARALESRRELDVMRLCLHYRAGGELVRAAELAEVGAREAASQLAFARAAELYAFALDHRAPDDRSTSLRVALGDALAGAGRSEEAGRAYEAAARASSAAERIDRTRRAAEQFLRAGRFAHGSALLDDVLVRTGVPIRRAPALALVSLLRRRSRLARESAAAPAPRDADALDPVEVARIDACTSGAMGLSVVDSLRSADLMSEALDRALRHGDGRRLAVCTLWQAAFAANEGQRGEARTRAWLARGEELAARHGGDYEAGCVQAASALTEFHVGRFRPAVAHCIEGSRVFLERTRGTLKESSTLHVFELASRAMLGELGLLGTRATELQADAEARGDRYALTNVLQGLPMLRWLAIDRPDRAHADLDRALEGFDAAGYVVQHFMDLLGRVLTLLYEGRAHDARARWERDRFRLMRSLLSRTEWTSVHVRRLDAWTALALAAGERGLRRQRWLFAAARDRRWLERHHCGWARALAPSIAASALAIEGRRGEARALLARSRDALVRHDLGLELAVTDVASGDPRGAAWAEAEGVARPDRLASAFLPGLSRSS